MKRNITNTMKIGTVTIGSGHPIAIQSMLSKPWDDLAGNLQQAKELEAAGCDILRVAIPTMESVSLIPALKQSVSMPIVADIHFDWRLALASLEAGVDKIRINPGNIGSEERVQAVAYACGERSVPIRIGVNSGSIEKSILEKSQICCLSTNEIKCGQNPLKIKDVNKNKFVDIFLDERSKYGK